MRWKGSGVDRAPLGSGSEPSLRSLIKKYDWEAVMARCTDDPNEIKLQHVRQGTALHEVCSIGSAPIEILEEFLRYCPEAATMKSPKNGETPLHLQCRNSQKQFGKVALLVTECPSAASIINDQGMSPLHVACEANAIACEANAMLPVLKILAKADPSMLVQPDVDGFTPVRRLWDTYARTMHGHASLVAARAHGTPKNDIKGYARGMEDHVSSRYAARWMEHIPEGHFRRFWQKMQYLTLEAYRRSEDDEEIQNDNSQKLAHAILSVDGCPHSFLSVSLLFNPRFAHAFEAERYPLHLLLSKPPGDKDDLYLLKVLLKLNPYAASVPDGGGRMPLSLAVESGWDWESISAIVSANPEELGLRDIKTGLCPFMLAASSSSSCNALENAYCLLLAKPELVEREE